MTPEERRALVAQVLGDAEATEELLSQPQLAELWKLHCWAFSEQMDLQVHVPEKSKRTASGWPAAFESDTAGYIKARVGELVRAIHPGAAPPAPSLNNSASVQRLRAMLKE